MPSATAPQGQPGSGSPLQELTGNYSTMASSSPQKLGPLFEPLLEPFADAICVAPEHESTAIAALVDLAGTQLVAGTGPLPAGVLAAPPGATGLLAWIATEGQVVDSAATFHGCVTVIGGFKQPTTGRRAREAAAQAAWQAAVDDHKNAAENAAQAQRHVDELEAEHAAAQAEHRRAKLDDRRDELRHDIATITTRLAPLNDAVELADSAHRDAQAAQRGLLERQKEVADHLKTCTAQLKQRKAHYENILNSGDNLLLPTWVGYLDTCAPTAAIPLAGTIAGHHLLELPDDATAALHTRVDNVVAALPEATNHRDFITRLEADLRVTIEVKANSVTASGTQTENASSMPSAAQQTKPASACWRPFKTTSRTPHSRAALRFSSCVTVPTPICSTNPPLCSLATPMAPTRNTSTPYAKLSPTDAIQDGPLCSPCTTRPPLRKRSTDRFTTMTLAEGHPIPIRGLNPTFRAYAAIEQVTDGNGGTRDRVDHRGQLRYDRAWVRTPGPPPPTVSGTPGLSERDLQWLLATGRPRRDGKRAQGLAEPAALSGLFRLLYDLDRAEGTTKLGRLVHIEPRPEAQPSLQAHFNRLDELDHCSAQRLVDAVPALAKPWASSDAAVMIASAAPSARARAELTTQLCSLAKALPADGIPLSVLAARTVRRTHGLDANTSLGRPAARLAAAIAGQPPPTSAAAVRNAWAAVGVLMDPVSSQAAGWQLPINPNHPAAAVANAYQATQGPAVLTLGVITCTCAEPLIASPQPNSTTLWVVEGISTLSVVAASDTPASVLCRGGTPSVAVARIITEAAAAGWRIAVSSDFEPGGLRGAIAALRHAGAAGTPWRLTTNDYLATPSEGDHFAPQDVPDTPWDPRLAPTMRQRQERVSEEDRLHKLLADLDASGRRTCAGDP